MTFFEFLATYSKVETLVGLASFAVAAVLGYLAYTFAAKYKMTAKIIEKANTKVKADLAIALLDADPTYKIPDLNQEQGFEIVKLQMEQKGRRFKSQISLARLGVVLFFLAFCVLFVKNYLRFSYVNGSGNTFINGDGNQVTHSDTTIQDNTKKE
jgi:hypothetical protein